MPKRAGSNRDLLAMALAGYEAEIARINAAIVGILAKLGKQIGGAPGKPARRKRRLSAAARKHIAAAQRKRWVESRKAKAAKAGAKATVTPKKRKLSAAARKRIGEATRKRWAA